VDPENVTLVEGLATSTQALASGTKKKKNKKKKGKKAADGEAAAPTEEEIKKSYVIGIDLGTTYSCVGVWENDGVTIIENRDGQKTIPSYVSYDPKTGQRAVGHAAKNQSVRFPNNTIYDVKRVIGQRFTDNGVEADISKMQYKMVAGEEGKPMIQVEIKGETVSFMPEEVSAMVLTHCKEIAEKYLGVEITRAVVTVPAYFNDSQRNATKAAGRIAGLDVLRIINEPTAAALSYGLDNKIKDGKAMNVLIFDLGGGTFDVSILTIEGGIFTVKATGGDTRLGGEDFDNNLVDHLLSEIEKQGLPDPRGDARSMMRLRKAAETAKREVSVSASAEIRLDAFMDKKDFKVKVAREKFENLNKGQFILCIDTVKRVLKDAKLKPADIDEIVLVGGSTRIPKLQEMLVTHFDGKTLCKSLNPDEAVAYGAAIQGAILCGTRNSKTDSLLLMDVTPLSLGIEIVGSVMSVVIPRNTPIPCVKTQTYTTERDYQTSDVVSVYEGERLRATENNLLGEFTIEGIEKAKKGEPQINVSFAIDSNGILNVTAMDQKTKCKAEITIANRSRATTEEIDKMVAEAAKYKAEDQERLAKTEAKNALEEAIYTALDLSKTLDDSKLANILYEAANKEQAWLDEKFEEAKASEIALHRRTLNVRMAGKNPNPFRG
jgi:L1 cell adhesion molecule like protein